MKRRDFLKNLGFSAVAIAVVPTIVIPQIQQIVEKEPLSNLPTGRLYLFDNKNLIAHSNQFSINVTPILIDATPWGSPWREYRRAGMEWSIEAEQMSWHYTIEDPFYYINNGIRLQAIAIKNECEIAGDVYFQNMYANIPSIGTPVYHAIELIGSGELIYKPKESNG